ncbi:MAG: hypothetical protein JW956_14880 [Calditrichaceae bacterium]|nr:hypothetical protein [Calditrichaceae bacterium]
MTKSYITPLLFILFFTIVFSGCSIIKQNKQTDIKIINNQQNQNHINESVTTSQSDILATGTAEKMSEAESIKYLPNGEIDISNWKTFKDNKLGFEIKYPPFLEMKDRSLTRFYVWKYAVDYKIDINWDLQCVQAGNGNYLYNLSYDERVKQLEDEFKTGDDYQKIDLSNGIILYSEFDNREKGVIHNLYLLRGMILNTNDFVMYCNNEIFEKNAMEQESQNDKYGKVFKAMLKTFRFLK